MCFTMLYNISTIFTMLYYVLICFTIFLFILQGFTTVYYFVLWFTKFYCVLTFFSMVFNVCFVLLCLLISTMFYNVLLRLLCFPMFYCVDKQFFYDVETEAYNAQWNSGCNLSKIPIIGNNCFSLSF